MFHLADHCQKRGFTDFEECTLNDTYGLADFLKKAEIGLLEPKDLIVESSKSLWTEDVTATTYGRHFTLNLGLTITREDSDFLGFTMDSNFFYSIWVHDDKYFLVNINPFRKKSCENVLFPKFLTLLTPHNTMQCILTFEYAFVPF